MDAARSTWPPPTPHLQGHKVRLERLQPSHGKDLATAAGENRSGYVWATVPEPDCLIDYIDVQLVGLAAVERVPFAQIRVADGRAVGCTSYVTPRFLRTGALFAVEIGATWLAASAMGTGINTEAKLLLLRHAFDVLGVQRVDLKTDVRNDRSRRAIAAIGATFEGVLHSWSPSRAPGEEDRLRDSAMFSITAAEWPGVEAALVARNETRLSPTSPGSDIPSE